MTDTMKLCSDDNTPLIFTMAFRGCEYWCPRCGSAGGMFGFGHSAPETPERLAERKLATKLNSKYLHAVAMIRGGACITDEKNQLLTFSELPKVHQDALTREYLEGRVNYKIIEAGVDTDGDD